MKMKKQNENKLEQRKTKKTTSERTYGTLIRDMYRFFDSQNGK